VFRWEELGILKRDEKGPLRIVGLAQRTGRIRCLICAGGRFLSATAAAGKTQVIATLSNLAEEQYTFTTEAKLAGRNIPS
jgi:hypothetical protein